MGYGGTPGPVPVGAPVVVRNTVFCGDRDMCAAAARSVPHAGIIGVTRPRRLRRVTTVPVANLCRSAGLRADRGRGDGGERRARLPQLHAAGLEATRTVMVQGAGSSSREHGRDHGRALSKMVLGTARGADRAARLAALPMYTGIVDSTAPDAREQITN